MIAAKNIILLAAALFIFQGQAFAGKDDDELLAKRPYGHDYFKARVENPAPAEKAVPLPDGYKSQYGDELEIQFKGKEIALRKAKIDKYGNIDLPATGLIRVVDKTAREISEAVETKGGKNRDVSITVKINAVLPRSVFVLGEVKNPGMYTVAPSERILDVLKRAGGPAMEGSVRKIELRRKGRINTLFDLYEYLDNRDETKNSILQPFDIVFITPSGPVIRVENEEGKSEMFELADPKGLADITALIGRHVPLPPASYLEVIRRAPGRDLEVVLEGRPEVVFGRKEFSFESGDLLRVARAPRAAGEKRRVKKETVFIEGEVKRPGKYMLPGEITVRDLVYAAGDPLKSAYLAEALVSSPVLKDGNVVGVETKKIDLGAAMNGDLRHNVFVKPNDKLVVERIADWLSERAVYIIGEVASPGKYILKEGDRLSSLIQRAGGYTGSAYLRGAVLTREGVRISRQKGFDEMISQLRSGSCGGTGEEQGIRDRFISLLREYTATGRLPVKLTHLILLRGSDDDIQMEDGDTLLIPSSEGSVTVSGSVMAEGVYGFNSGNYRRYIDAAGGFAPSADKDNVYVLKVDGSLDKLSVGNVVWNPYKLRWEVPALAGRMRIEAGDTIIVLPKAEAVKWLCGELNASRILLRTAVTTGTVIPLP